MKCLEPFRNPQGEYGCSQCTPCRINRQRVWITRLLLEQQAHAVSCFATLTYDEHNQPPELTPAHPRAFLKALRKLLPRPLRYYLVGEYGDRTFRPHYHALLYGVSPMEAPLVQTAWSRGFIHLGDLTPETARYVTGYTIKKMTATTDPRLANRHPEFARMSLKPGIGRNALQPLAHSLTSQHPSTALANGLDVPTQFRFQNKLLPIGRYLTRKLREDVGWSPDTPAPKQQETLLRLTLETGADLDEKARVRSVQKIRSKQRAERASLGRHL
ncbi:MAG: replication initiator protein [Microvirus sp.]|nr:MAG: replication initiator protein [Microvirus sp.]